MSFRIKIYRYDKQTSPYSEEIHTWLYGYYQIIMGAGAEETDLFKHYEIQLIREYLRGTFKEIILQTKLYPDLNVDLDLLKIYRIGSQEDKDYFKMWSQHEHIIET
jgi:hypothetical protein